MAANLHDDGPARGGNRWRMAIWGTAAGLLLLPAVAMRFPGSGVDWTASDFVVMGALLATACGAYELGTRLSGNTAYRAGFAAAVLGSFLLVWVNLAVGLVGDGANPANLMFMALPLVVALGAILARFRAAGMARTMFATAALHALVGAIAVAGGWGLPVNGPLHTAGVTAVFLLPWLVSAALFHRAARRSGAR